MKKFYAEFNKFDDEQRIVSGYASTEALDSQGEIVKREAMERALPDYMKFGNIREMHQPSAVGVAVSAKMDDGGLLLEAKIIDPVAWEKVKAGVYKGFSIGGHVTNRDKINKNTITGIHLKEISIVDRPANPEALFDVWKDGVTQKGMFGVGRLAELLAGIQDVAQSAEWEEEIERDNSSIPQALQDWLKTGGQLLIAMTEEEVSEMTQNDNTPDVEVVALADKAGELAKRGKLTGANKDSAQAIHDHACAMGASCNDAEKATLAGDLQKASSAADDLHKAIETLTAERDNALTKVTALEGEKAAIETDRDTIKKELDTLKAQPEPMQGKVMTASAGEQSKLGDQTVEKRDGQTTEKPKFFGNGA